VLGDSDALKESERWLQTQKPCRVWTTAG
jgi:hypothetical protein